MDPSLGSSSGPWVATRVLSQKRIFCSHWQQSGLNRLVLLKSGRRRELELQEELDDELEDEVPEASEIDALVDTGVVDLRLHRTFRRDLAMAST